jgi:trimeric autotransporter adhesin
MLIVLRHIVMAVLACWVLAVPAIAAVVACTPTAGFTACLRYTYSGGTQTFTVPTGISNLEIRAWGAAGGGANATWYTGQGGGAGGGFASGTLATTPGQTLNIVVGQGGIPNSTAGTFGGGGAGGNRTGNATAIGASGGGYSGVFAPGAIIQANAHIVAGGGGGASPGADGGAAGAGGGGGTTGGQDALPIRSGRGGTQIAGGAAATGNSSCAVNPVAGAALQGGNGGSSSLTTAHEGGGGGGGGYFGGGGGLCQSGSGTQNGGGGGGASYIAGTGVSAGATTAGQNFLYANAACAGTANSGGAANGLYTAGIGQGSCYGTGGNGEVIIQYLITTITITKISNGNVSTFSFSGDNGYAGDSITTVTQGTPVSGTTRYLANANTPTTISETIPPDYKITAISCSGTPAANYTVNTTTGEVVFAAAAIVPNNALACTFTNEKLVPGLTLLKTASPAGPVAAGNTITYTFRLTNSGNTAISNVIVNELAFTGYGIHPVPGSETLLTDTAPAGDSTTGTANDGIWATLGPGDIITMTSTYVVTQADIDNQ